MFEAAERSGAMSDPDKARLDELQARLGVEFRDPEILAQALIHRSVLRDNPDSGLQSNERLEFLGDAIIGALVAKHLYDHLPAASEGELTLVRTNLVRASTLGAWGGSLRLHEFLRLGRSDESTHRRTRLLARTFEAVVGAIYADQGVRGVSKFLRPFISAELKRQAPGRPRLDAKSRLQQVSQARFDQIPRYAILSVVGPGHDPTFTVEVTIGEHFRGTATGGTKQEAEQAAAGVALETLDVPIEEPSADASSGGEPEA